MPASPYSYIRRTYGVDPVIGSRVRHTVTEREGQIVRPTGDPQYVRVRFDGDKHIMNAHPTELDYKPQEQVRS